VILLAEHDESTLAAKKKRQPGASSWPTSTPKNRVWGFANIPSGRPNIEAGSSWENATGSVQYTYQNASGRAEWLSRDPLSSAETRQGPNLYEYCLNDPVRYNDPDGRIIPVVVAGILLIGGGLDHEFDMVMACENLQNGQGTYIRTPLTIMASLFSGVGAGIAQGAANGPAIYMMHVWKDNCGNCHSAPVIVPVGPGPGA
jgi:RHS repeat-associated protein